MDSRGPPFSICKMKQEMVMVPKGEYEKLKKQADIDIELLHQLLASFRDIKEGRVQRVK